MGKRWVYGQNDRLIDHCDLLIAFPHTTKETRRSGTWATVRRARNASKKVIICSLDKI